MSISSSGRPSRCAHHQLELLAPDDRVRRGGRGDDDVGARPSWSGSSSSEHDRAAEALGERAGAVGVAVGDEDRRDALRRRAPARSARSSRRRRGSRRGAPRGRRATLPREVDGDRRTRSTRPAPMRGLGAHALAGLQRGGEQAVGQRPGRAGVAARARSARRTWPWTSASPTIIDSRPAVDAVELARGVAVARRVDRVGELGRADARRASASRAEHVGLGADRVADDEVDLGAVAGRDRDGLADLVGRDQLAQRTRSALRSVKRERARAARPARSCARCRARAARSSTRRLLALGARRASRRATVGQLVDARQLASSRSMRPA